jgi:hypothetical protein
LVKYKRSSYKENRLKLHWGPLVSAVCWCKKSFRGPYNEFGFNWSSGFGEKGQNVKRLQTSFRQQMQSIPITTKTLTLITSLGKMHLIQLYVIKVVRDMLQVTGFFCVF